MNLPLVKLFGLISRKTGLFHPGSFLPLKTKNHPKVIWQKKSARDMDLSLTVVDHVADLFCLSGQ